MKFLLAPAALVVLGFSLACSSDDESSEGDTINEPVATATSAFAGGSAATATPQNDGNSAPATSTPANGGSSATVQEVTVTAGERGQSYYFDVSSTTLQTGTVSLTFTNSGPDRPHSFAVRTSGGQTIVEVPETQVGGTRTVEFELPSAGTYQFICTLRGHSDRGQSGTFTVQ